MLNIKKLLSNGILKSIIVLASGSVLAQLITLLASPFITRIYGPEALGILGNFTAILNILMPIAGLCLPMAIVLPEKDEDSKKITILATIFSIIFSGVILVLVILFKDNIELPFSQDFLYLLPLVIIFSTQLQITQQWCIRKEKFRVLSNSSVLQSLILNLSKITFGMLNSLPFVLILISSFAPLSHLSILKLKNKIKIFNMKRPLMLKVVYKKYNDFVIYRTPQVLINGLSQSIPIFLLTYYFGAKYAGYYALTNTILNVPTLLVSKSISDVFYPRFSRLIKDSKLKAFGLFRNTTISLVPLSLIPLTIFVLWGEELFSLIFGDDWIISGLYSKLIAISSLFMLISRPAISAIPSLGLQKHLLIIEILSVFLRGGAFILGYFIYKDHFNSVLFFAIANSVIYLAICIIVYKGLNKNGQRYE
ncbi:lipopolysaccharide biosynthesis protein [Vibrio alfacsensis]|uniref:lipopolysaccharide biosynthesis protein n=1 Tax=Vibrio alfacsensis TaxID=1074311 RepID=UPI004068B7E0